MRPCVARRGREARTRQTNNPRPRLSHTPNNTHTHKHTHTHTHTQTVENFFDFASHVKNGNVSLALNEQRLPVVRQAQPPKEGMENTQIVVPLTMQDVRRMAEGFKVEDGDIAARTRP